MTALQLIEGLKDIEAGRISTMAILDMAPEIIAHLREHIHTSPAKACYTTTGSRLKIRRKKQI